MNPCLFYQMLHDAKRDKRSSGEKIILGIVSIVASVVAIWIMVK